jgi:uncharacterized protein
MTQINPTPGKLRLFFAHPGVLLILGFILTSFAYGLSQGLTDMPNDLKNGIATPWVILKAIIGAVALVFVYWLFVRFIERKPFTDFALPGAVKEAGLGLLIGALLFSTIVGVIALFGSYAVTGTNDPSVLIPVFAMSLSAGVGEEIMLRGVFFRYAEDWLGSWAALALSAALFGALHLGNDNASPLAAFAIAIEAGVMLAAIYMITRRLWAAVGLHFAWNFVQGGIYDIAVSGLDTDAVLEAKMSGSELITGGAFGAEASLPAMVLATAAGVAMLVVAHRNGQFIAPRWVRRRAALHTKL